MTTAADIASETIREAVRIAVAAGNSLRVLSAEWKPKQVAFMDRAISSETRSEILSALPDLEHTVTEPTPHNPCNGDLHRQSERCRAHLSRFRRAAPMVLTKVRF